MTTAITIHHSIASLPPALAQLLDTAGESVAFDQTRPWFECFERHLLAPAQTVFHIGVEDCSDGRALALLSLRSGIGGPSWLPQQGLFSLSNYYTTMFAPIVAPDADAVSVTRALVESVIGELPRWQFLDLCPMALEQPWFRGFVAAFRSAGFFVRPYFKFGNWTLPLAGQPFAEYFKSRPSRVQSTLKRKLKKFESQADAKLTIVTQPADVDAAMDGYEQIYNRSWKGGEAYPAFIREVAREFAVRGWLRLGLVTIGGRPAAAQLWFVRHGIAGVYKLAYDPEFTELSPGSILTMRLFQHVIDSDKVSMIDYLAGDDAYKRDWMTMRRERWGCIVAPHTSLVGALERGRRTVRNILRRDTALAERNTLAGIGL